MDNKKIIQNHRPFLVPNLNRNRKKGVSLVLPVWNESENLHNIFKLISASKKVNEVIFVDDASTDNSVELISNYALNDTRVVLVRHENNLGILPTRKTGVQNSNYSIICFLDADLYGVTEKIIDEIVTPIVEDKADFVLADFFMEGRVTELVARPLLKACFPELALLGQPLSGQMALKAEYFFPERADANLGYVIDAWFAGARIGQAAIGKLEHSHRDIPVKIRQAQRNIDSFLIRYREHLMRNSTSDQFIIKSRSFDFDFL